MPPASETTSGRLATAKSARTSEAVMPAARAAYRRRWGSRLRLPAVGRLADRGHAGSVQIDAEGPCE